MSRSDAVSRPDEGVPVRIGVTLVDLRRAAELLPPGSAVTLSRETLLDALRDAGNPQTGDLTVLQLSRRFSRSESTVRSWLASGLLRGYRLRGREWRIPVAAVTEFEQAERDGRKPEYAGVGRVSDLGAWRGVKED